MNGSGDGGGREGRKKEMGEGEREERKRWGREGGKKERDGGGREDILLMTELISRLIK